MPTDDGSGNGVWTVPGEHLPGLIALVVTPLVLWLLVLGCRGLAGRGSDAATRVLARLHRLSFGARVAVVACVIGATVHAAMVATHWGDERSTAILFCLDAAGFLAVATWTLGGWRGWRLASCSMLAVTCAAYIFYVLERGESVDLVGLVMTTIELAAVSLVLQPAVELRSSAPAYPWVAAVTLPVALVAVFSLTAFDAGGAATSPRAGGRQLMSNRMPGMRHGSAAAGGMAGMGGMAKGSGAALKLPTQSPAGAVTWPVSYAGMTAGMTMSEPHCTARPTAAQQLAAVRLVNRTAAAVARYRSLAVARAAGYVPITPAGRTVVHYINPDVYLGARPLDPRAVPSLVYVNTPTGAVLSAAMYLMPLASSGRPPQPGGCLTQWHVHSNLCFRGFRIVATTVAGSCPTGTVNAVTPPMMHVWLIPVPGGPLAMDATDQAQVRAAARLPGHRIHNGTA